MHVLATLFKWFGGLFVQALIEKVSDYLKKRKAEKEAQGRIDKAAQEALEALKKAKTKEEIDEAARRALDDL